MKSKIVMLGLFLLFAILVFYFFIPVESFEYAISVDVTGKEKEIGFDVTNVSFVFGVLPRGASAVRSFDITTDAKRRIGIGAAGEIKPWLHISKNNFNLFGKETLTLSIRVPENARPGHYEGKIKIKSYRTI